MIIFVHPSSLSICHHVAEKGLRSQSDSYVCAPRLKSYSMSVDDDQRYRNFVRASIEPGTVQSSQSALRGEDARRLYLEEVKDIRDPQPALDDDTPHRIPKHRKTRQCKQNVTQCTDKDLFVSAQNNDVDTLKQILDISPDKINIVDDYGWSLLMIACQANAIDSAQELLTRNINTGIRDKAGNSAQSLVIRNKNYALASILIDHKSTKRKEAESGNAHKKVKLKEEFICELCNNKYYYKDEHYSSTVHNINACKGRKIPTNYLIPSSNKGYQLMLKGGWDKESGLGPDGSGKKYPIKTVQKKDRKGLGHGKKKEEKPQTQGSKLVNRESLRRDCNRNRNMEINFRREFY